MSGARESELERRIAQVQRWLTAIYRLEIPQRAEQFLISPKDARSLLPPGSPRSGLAVVEERDALWLGLYLDPRDQRDSDTLVEETSHWVCVAWHATYGRRVSRLLLELQGEIDRYVIAHLTGRDAFRHFRDFLWAEGMDAPTRDRYRTAHRTAYRYCRSLARRFPGRADVPQLLAELRSFYRATGEAKLRAGFA
ncbi:MAG: hypothetical protein OEM49_07620 [Myxococcales bacterium]|nr:hypothetical protein [Myxococcales bacterium]MDH5305679.1 hypothetical protein [Myxococcales bacterium]MDH5567589.1 hypothetical protein [Myxococcales bacterium]